MGSLGRKDYQTGDFGKWSVTTKMNELAFIVANVLWRFVLWEVIEFLHSYPYLTRMRVSIVLLFGVSMFRGMAQDMTPAQLVQQQLDGYNQGDIELFLKPYADTVKLYNHPNTLIGQGKDQMRSIYTDLFERVPDLNCTLMNRMVLDDIVIDQEYVIMSKDQPASEVIAMYRIAWGKIVEVYFVRPSN